MHRGARGVGPSAPSVGIAATLGPVKRRILSTPAATRTRRAVLVAAGAVAVSATLSACSMFNPAQTDVPYNPADGVPAQVGNIALRDLTLVGKGDGPAVLSGSAINLGVDPATVSFALQDAPGDGAEVQLTPREQVNLAASGATFTLVKSKPGTIVPVVITAPGGTTIASVPVLAPEGAYATVTPAPTATN